MRSDDLFLADGCVLQTTDNVLQTADNDSNNANVRNVYDKNMLHKRVSGSRARFHEPPIALHSQRVNRSFANIARATCLRNVPRIKCASCIAASSHLNPLQCIFVSFHFIALQFISGHFISFHFIILQRIFFISFPVNLCHFISFPYISFHFISFHVHVRFNFA